MGGHFGKQFLDPKQKVNKLAKCWTSSDHALWSNYVIIEGLSLSKEALDIARSRRLLLHYNISTLRELELYVMRPGKISTVTSQKYKICRLPRITKAP